MFRTTFLITEQAVTGEFDSEPTDMFYHCGVRLSECVVIDWEVLDE